MVGKLWWEGFGLRPCEIAQLIRGHRLKAVDVDPLWTYRAALYAGYADEQDLQTLRRFTENESSRGTVTRIVLAETMGVVGDTNNAIINPPTFDVEQSRQDGILTQCMEVVRMMCRAHGHSTEYQYRDQAEYMHLF